MSIRGCCTLDQVKQRLGLGSTATDAVLEGIIVGVGAQFAAHCHREFVATAEAVTMFYDGGTAGGDVIYLDYMPVIEVVSVVEAYAHEHAEADDLVANDDYIVAVARGRLVRATGSWLRGTDAVRVVYRGGYTPAGDTPGDNEQSMPDAVVEAAIQQSCFVFQRRNELGLTSVSAGDGSINSYAKDRLLPGVEAMLAPYRRILL